jgi:hypothetical protein
LGFFFDFLLLEWLRHIFVIEAVAGDDLSIDFDFLFFFEFLFNLLFEELLFFVLKQQLLLEIFVALADLVDLVDLNEGHQI